MNNNMNLLHNNKINVNINKKCYRGARMNDKFKQLFGIKFDIAPIKIKGLPLYITAGRGLYKLSYLGNEFILVRLSADEKFGVVALEKQISQVSLKTGMPVALEFEYLSRTQRDSLLKRNIPFISESGQLYLPFLGMILYERFVQKKNETELTKMMPITQALFLYLIYKSEGKPIMKKEAAEFLGVTRTSITRASEQLITFDLISQQMRGKESYMSIKGKGLEIYKKARQYLINPIQRKITVLNDNAYRSYSLSGESALSKCTMLNAPLVDEYAIYKANIDINNIAVVDSRWEPESNVINLELWKYDPRLFEINGLVDPISLSLCFEDNADERIEASIEEYLEEYKW